MDLSSQNEREVDEKQAVSDRTGRYLLRDALETMGLNSFENTLNAVEEFLTNIDLFDPNVAFGSAAEALGMAALAFVLIDRDRDRKLSHAELSQYANKLDGRAKELIEWLLIHFDAIERAGFFHKNDGISRSDLLSAYSVFKGMDFVHNHFSELSRMDCAEQKETLTHVEIDRYADQHSPQLDRHVEQGLRHFARYLRRLELTHGGGLTAGEFEQLTPEMLWTA